MALVSVLAGVLYISGLVWVARVNVELAMPIALMGFGLILGSIANFAPRRSPGP